MTVAAWLALLLLLGACDGPAVDEDETRPGEIQAGVPSDHGSGGRNSEWATRQPYLVLVSIDGFRHDYLERYPAPAMQRIAASGVRARALVPVFPTLTFPNHYSIATGLFPARHGIVANNFPDEARDAWYAYKDRDSVQDGRWYGGEPIWVAAERHGMVSAAYFFVGTEAPVSGISPTHWSAFDREISGEQRVDQVIEWLSRPAERRPHVITLYFEEVDETSHRHGPGSPESIAAIVSVDQHIDRLMEGLASLPIAEEVTVMIVSDHGQSSYDENAEVLVLDEIIDLEQFSVVDGGTYAFLFAEGASPEDVIAARDAINGGWEGGRAWLRDEAPAAWRLSAGSRFPELIVQAAPGHGVIATADRDYIMTSGDHGWAPEFSDMHGIFITAGPRLPAGRVIEPIRAVDIYPLMRALLRLPPLAADGDPEALMPLLDPP